jgi:PAS domain S-box-containing protein
MNTKISITPLRAAIAYVMIGWLLLLSSEILLPFYFIQASKEFLFVAVTGFVLYMVLRKQLNGNGIEFSSRSSEERYKILVEQAPDGIFVSDDNGRFLDVNERGCSMLGYSRNEILSMNLMNLIPSEDLAAFPVRFNDLSVGKTVIIERRLICKDGSLLNTEISAHMLTDGRIQGIVRDITERKQIEEALSKSESRYHSLFNNMLEGFVYAKTEFQNNTFVDLTILNVNHAFEKLTGLNNIINKRFSEVFPEFLKSQSELLYYLNKLGSTNETQKFETYFSPLEKWFTATLYNPDREHVVVIFDDISERKKAEEKVTASERKYREVIENANDIIYTTDLKGTFTYCNPAGLKQTGYSAEDIHELNYLDIVLPEHCERVKRLIFKQFLQKTPSLYLESPFKKKSGEIAWMGQNSTLLFDKGTVIGFQMIARDITEQTLAEKKLLQSQQQYEKLVNTIDGIVWEADAQTLQFTFVSNQVERILGYSPKQWMNEPNFWREHIHPDDQAWAIAFCINETAKKTSHQFEYRMIAADRSIVWVRDIVDVSVKDNQPDMLRGLLIDISDRKVAEEAASESINRYRELVEFSPDAIMIHSDGKFVFINNAALLLFGAKDKEEILGRQILDFVHPDFHQKVKSRIHNIISKDTTVPMLEEQFVKLDGSTVWVEVAAQPFVFEGKTSVQVIARNITDRKMAEEVSRNTKLLLEQTFEQSPVPMILVSMPDAILRYVNPACLRFLGIEDEPSVINTPLMEYKPSFQDFDLQGTLGTLDELPLARSLKGLKTESEERYIVRKDGTIRYELVNGTPILDDNGNVIAGYLTMIDITERKLAEKEISMLAQTIKGISECVSVTDVNDTILFVNKAFEDTYKYSMNEIIGKSINVIRSSKTPPEIGSQILPATLAGGWRGEIWNKKKDGTEFPIMLSTSTVKDQYGNITALVGIAVDITATKHAEEQMKRAVEMQMLQTTALESTANGIVITNVKGEIVWVNQAYSKITGYSFEEVRGRNPRILKSGKQTEGHYKELWETILSGKVWHGEFVNKRKDGSLYTDEMTITPVRNTKNVITHFVAVKQDVTDRIKSIQMIEEQAMLLDKAHDAIILQGLDFSVLYWNKGAEQLFGWKTEEALGKDIRSLIFRNPNDFQKEWNQLLINENFSEEFNLRTKEGRNIIVDGRLNVIKDQYGKPKSVLSMSSDITDKKKIEEQFLRTQRMGSLGTLAGGIAHDLNNVLAPILLAVEFLKMTYVNETSQKILEAVESSTRRGSEIVKQILTFARGIETQKVLIQPRHLIKEIVSIFKETFPRSITITSDIPNTIWTILGDPTHFHQLIMNLGVNARDAMPDGGTLSITAANEIIDKQYVRMNIDAKVGRYVMFSVKDTGIGMSPQIIDHVFEPFFTTKEIGKGTGLGLSTVYAIVKSHNGFIKIHSEVGKGTTFNIFMPASASISVETETTPSRQDFFGNGELILVVDDEKSIRDVTQETLEMYKYTVITASDGAEGVAQFSEYRDRIALVLTDMMMPVMDGHHLIITLRKMSPGIKIIASSGLIEKQINMDNAETAVNAFIEKPYTAEKLMSVVSSIVKGTEIVPSARNES